MKKKDKERLELMGKIDITKTKYYGYGFDNATTDELKGLFELFPLWSKLTQQEKEHFNKKQIASVTLKEYLQAEYGGLDVEIIKEVIAKYNAAVEYVKSLQS